MNENRKTLNEVGLCLASMSFFPLYAGPAVRFHRYAPGLMERGVRVHVFTQALSDELIARDGSLAIGGGTGLESQSMDVAQAHRFEVIDGLPVYRTALPGGWRRQPAYFGRLMQYCEERRDEIDVIQFLSLSFAAAPWVRRLRSLGIGIVFTHTLMGELSTNRWRRAFQRFLRRGRFNLADRVVVSSNVMKWEVEDLGVSSPIHVIPNGVDLERFRPIESCREKASLRKRLGLDPTWDVVMAVGPIIPRKGTDVLIEAFVRLCADHPDARLVLVGPRHDLGRNALSGFREHLRGMMADANVSDKVIFAGPVSNVEDYLRCADILVFASRREGMPNVIPEAMGCGIPVITTPFIGLPQEFGTADVHYTLSDWDAVAMSSAIHELLGQPEYRQRLGRAGRSWVELKLDVNQSIDQYVELYRELARRPTKGTHKTQ